MAFTEQQACSLLKATYEKQRLPHAILISGSEDDGSHSIPLNLISFINKVTLREQDSLESFTDEYCPILSRRQKSRRILIDDIRSVEPFLQQRSPQDKYKIVVILDAERMNDEASNAFLKTLEEPPSRSCIFLVTAQPEQLLETIRSRCIGITLYSPNAGIRLTLIQQELLPLLADAFAHIGDDLAAIAFRSSLQTLLANRKNEITKTLTQAIKEEAKIIGQGTDNTSWESQNKDITAAYIETEYLAERDLAIDLIISWFGQAILLASGASLDAPIHNDVQATSSSMPTDDLIQRMEAIEEFRNNLKFNIHEGLAMDVAFLKAFGQR